MKTKVETKKTVIVKQDIDNPEPVEIIAKSIIEISNACEKINKSSLKERAILLLINDITGLPLGTIQKVLKALPELKKQYIK